MLLLFLVSFPYLSYPRISYWTGGVLSRLNSFTHRSSQCSLRKFCFLVTLAVLFLAFTATYKPSVELFISLESAEVAIHHAACAVIRPRTSLISLHCPATGSLQRLLFGDSLSLCDLWSRPRGVAWLLGLHGLLSCLHFSEGVGW